MGDEWLIGRWVAQLGDGWLSWVAKLVRWVAKLVACLFATKGSGSNPDIYQKYKIGDISKGVSNTLYPPPPKKRDF